MQNLVFGAVAHWCGIGLFRLLALLKDELLHPVAPEPARPVSS
ncbi:hypothetical protein [Calditerricola satsumensis]|uniref:Uncharacterized protein n=1 Tax=Calditerricola satsumensis TaxID=373054 RepID=A0A8J3FB32_9BACI|nr:hypothetical protein [Calditerricola satsumensis]GGJ99773.1 hypothetical protein GCM10007043_12300 [Calditerricola satsumensis]